MESILSYLNNLPQEYIFLGFLGLLFITMLGLVPNNSDLTIIVGVLFCLNSSFDIYQFTTSVLILVLHSLFLMVSCHSNTSFGHAGQRVAVYETGGAVSALCLHPRLPLLIAGHKDGALRQWRLSPDQ